MIEEITKEDVFIIKYKHSTNTSLARIVVGVEIITQFVQFIFEYY